MKEEGRRMLAAAPHIPHPSSLILPV
jgi:hypothetical protein